MSSIQIPNLPVAIALNGTEQLEIVQAGVSVQTTTAAVSGLTPGATGPRGPTGPTGAASSVAGPTGPTGAASSVAGPTGPTGAASSVAGPTGPTGAASSVAGPTGPTGSTAASGATTNVQFNLSGSFSGDSGFTYAGSNGAVAIAGALSSAAHTITSASATGLTVGRLGATTPAFTVDASTATQVAGLKITGAATGGTVALVATDSGSNTNLTLNANGSGTIGIGSVSTGRVTITPATTITGSLTLSAALIYGGVTLSNAVTGTGNMVLSASPTLSGTVGGALTFSGALTLSSALNYGGVTLSNSVTGTGSMVLSTSPQFATSVGIGMTPSNVLDITQNQNAPSIANILNNNASGASQAGYWASNGTNSARLGVLGTGYSSTGTFQAGYGLVYASSGLSLCSGGGPILFGANTLSEVARFGTNGSFLVGTTTNGGWSGASSIAAFGTNTNGISSQVAGSSGGNAFLARVESTAVYLFGFYYGASSVGSITTNGTSTSYNTSSDYRLKENVQPMTGGLTTVLALKPVTYDWISNGSAGEGFIAHELQAVIPDAVHGEKDAVNEDGSINAQGVDFSKIVPHLVAAIQELTARLTALENK